MPFASRDDLDLMTGSISMLPGSDGSNATGYRSGLGSSASIYARNKARWDKFVTTGDKGKPFWFMKGPDPWVAHAPNNMLPFGQAAWVTWIVDYVRSTKNPDTFPEPPFDAPLGGWGVWAQVMFRDFGLDFIPEPEKGTQKHKVWLDARYRATHTGGFLGGVARTFRQVGGIIISAVGAVLAPFTGGASMIAASLVTTAIKVVNAKQAATAAKSRAAADAAQVQAEADRQTAALSIQVDKFYNENTAWFLQHTVTPDKWGKMTLDQKIELINAGVQGKWPDSSKPVTVTPAQQIKVLEQTAVAAQQAGIPPAAVIPESAAQVPPPTPPPPPPAPDPPPGKYEIVVEGRKVGETGSVEEASSLVMANTTVGQRFEVYFNGVSTGMKVRTSSGAVDVDPKAAALPPEKMSAIVTQAEADTSKGGFPWWLLVAGGAAAAVAA